MLVVLVAAVLGLVLGSFLSVLLERMPRGGVGIVAGRSRCPHCRHALAWYDLVPLVSYAMLAGRCRYCRGRVSALYPALEVSVAAVFGLYAFRFGVAGPWQAVDLVLLFGLVALFFFDLRYLTLPDALTLPLVGIAAVRLLALRPDLLANAAATGAVLAAFFGGLHAVSRGRWVGLGDVKLAVFVGMLFGYPGAVGVTLSAIWAGALTGGVLMLAGRATMKTAIPFGSFWAAAAAFTMLWPGPVYYISGLFVPAF